MSPIARLGGWMFSVLIHVALGASIIALSSAHWTSPLFVDLLERPEPVGPAGGAPAAPARRPVVPSSPSPALPHTTGGVRSAAAAPVEPPARVAEPAPPAPIIPVSPIIPEPIAPAAPIPPPPPPVVAPQPNAPVSPPASAAAPAAPVSAPPGRVGRAEPGSTARASGETRGDVGSAVAATGGSAFALATPGAGSGSVPTEYGPYLRRFRQRVQEALVYPLAARRQGLGGTVELEVLLEATGRIGDVRVVRSSAHDVLDEAALETIRRLGAIPFPETLPRRPLLIRIPLVFELR